MSLKRSTEVQWLDAVIYLLFMSFFSQPRQNWTRLPGGVLHLHVVLISEHIAKQFLKIEQSVGVEQIVAGNRLHRTERSADADQASSMCAVN